MQKRNDMGTLTGRPPAGTDTAHRASQATTGGTSSEPGWLQHPAGKTLGGRPHAGPVMVAPAGVIPLPYPARSLRLMEGAETSIPDARFLLLPATDSRGMNRPTGCYAENGVLSPLERLKQIKIKKLAENGWALGRLSLSSLMTSTREATGKTTVRSRKPMKLQFPSWDAGRVVLRGETPGLEFIIKLIADGSLDRTFDKELHTKRNPARIGGWAITLISALAAFQMCLADAQETLWLAGHLSVKQRIAWGSAEIAEQACRFQVQINKDGQWSLKSTNLINSNLWATAYFDGYSVFYIKPSIARIVENGFEVETNSLMTSIWYGPLLLTTTSFDLCRIPELWMVFCAGNALRFYMITNHTVHWPVPVWSVRRSLVAWGFRWHLPKDRKWLTLWPWFDNYKIVRDTSLDLKKAEDYMLLPDLDYPWTTWERETFVRHLDWLRSYTNGALGVTVDINDWLELNGINCPKNATVTVYTGGPNNKPATWIIVQVTNAAVQVSQPISPPLPASGTTVNAVDDYRYRRKSSKREFTCATYTLRNGDAWKGTNDPVLIAVADQHMRAGAAFALLSPSTKRYIFLSMGALLVLTPLWLVFGRRVKISQNKTNNNKTN